MDANHRTAATIAAAQHADGAIPWYPDGPLDPWNHVEAAMGLDTVGRHAEAAAAYRWLARHQNDDGSWYAEYRHRRPHDLSRDANFTAYVAVGCHHHFRSTQDERFLVELWPTIEAAVRFALALQQPTGAVRWRRRPGGGVSPEALLTGSASVHHALLCAAALADHLDRPRPAWPVAARRLRAAILDKPHLFVPKPHAMDWYYPVLAGTLTGTSAAQRIAEGWDRFVVPGHGVRCVDHEPWVTAGETAELALTLAARGNRAGATELLDTLAPLRRPDGAYWTGHNYATNTIWPREHTTWTAGAILLANAAVNHDPATVLTFAMVPGMECAST